jgi:hypothetical protein
MRIRRDTVRATVPPLLALALVALLARPLDLTTVGPPPPATGGLPAVSAPATP